MTHPTTASPTPSARPKSADSDVTAFERILKPLASLRITVVLFALSIFLTFVGTTMQVRFGIWTIVDELFRSVIARIEIASIFIYAWDIPGVIYFPGGWLIGGALLVNLIAAHAIRFRIKAQGRDLVLGSIVLLIGIGVTWLVLAGKLQSDVATSSSDAFWRVLWRLGQGIIAAVVLYAGCLLLFRKRAGMVLLHAGIILLLISELITGLFAVESRMTIAEGETVNYVDRQFDYEFAVIDTSNPEHDVVTSIPVGDSVRRGDRISPPGLPFDIKVEQWMVNSTIPMSMSQVGPPMQARNLATTGEGRRFLILPRPEGAGVDAGSGVDTPSAYITLFDRTSGTPLGTYLTSLWFYPNHNRRVMDVPQTVTADGKTYSIYLRNQREYLTSAADRSPFDIKLLDFRHEVYPGTTRPKDFSSFIRLTDADRGVDREVRIWMNNPLRYAGLTFYQSSFLDGDTGTVLQVVRNVGWMVPYVSCMIVGMGMAGHFGQHLLEFLRKRRQA
jgi:hypothetical protein